MTKPSPRLTKLMCDFYQFTEDNVGSYIMETTSTKKRPLALSAMCTKILGNLDDLDWVRDEGYYSEEETPFAQWKKCVRDYVKREAEALERLNQVAEAAAAVIDELYPDKVKEGA